MTSKNLSKKSLNNSNILILGEGYVGTILHQSLTDHGYNVISKSRKDLDYHIPSDLMRFVLNSDIDVVINCSGFTGKPNVDEAEIKKDECWNLNVMIPKKIAELCNNIGVKLIHVSSGCIYSGYDKEYKETDTPDFGLYHDSSFYSKSKHAFETITTNNRIKILRIRMPICFDLDNDKNYLKKIMNYPNLVDFKNSKTFIPELGDFINAMLQKQDLSWSGQDIYNVVHSTPLSTFEVVWTLNVNNQGKWKELKPNWVDMDELDIKAPRSNCILNNDKAMEIFQLSNEREIMVKLMNNINNN